MLQPRSCCLKLPNTSSYTEVSSTPKLLISALSKAAFQSLLYAHICLFRELQHTKQWIHSSAATSSLLTIYSCWKCPDHTAKWAQEKNLDTEMIALHCHQNTLFPDLKFPTKHWPNNASLVSSANFSASWCFNVYNIYSLRRTSCWNIQGHNKNSFTSRVSSWFQRLAYSLQIWSELRRSEEQWSWPVWSLWKANTALRG